VIVGAGSVVQAVTGDSLLGLATRITRPRHETPVTTTVTTIAFSEADLDREANPRFSFSFAYPREWNRRDPVNGDGNAYVAPRDDGKDVRMAAWGSYADLQPTLEDWVAHTVADVHQLPSAKILQNLESGLHLWTFPANGQGGSQTRQQIRGWRLKYEYTDNEAGTLPPS
jgi:hypothetical protein